MTQPLKLSELADEMDGQIEDFPVYYNRKTGQFVYAFEDIQEKADSEKPLEEIDK